MSETMNESIDFFGDFDGLFAVTVDCDNRSMMMTCVIVLHKAPTLEDLM